MLLGLIRRTRDTPAGSRTDSSWRAGVDGVAGSSRALGLLSALPAGRKTGDVAELDGRAELFFYAPRGGSRSSSCAPAPGSASAVSHDMRQRSVSRVVAARAAVAGSTEPRTGSIPGHARNGELVKRWRRGFPILLSSQISRWRSRSSVTGSPVISSRRNHLRGQARRQRLASASGGMAAHARS